MKDERRVAGGLARAKALSPERRSEIARMAALARHGKIDVAAPRRAQLRKQAAAMKRVAKAMERFGREMLDNGATLAELTEAAGRVTALLHSERRE